MSAADIYFDGEIAALRDKRSAAKAAELAEKRAYEKRRAEERRRREFYIDVERDEEEICLLDIDADLLRRALEELDEQIEDSAVTAAMREARRLYLCGRKADAMDALYPTILDSLGAAL